MDTDSRRRVLEAHQTLKGWLANGQLTAAQYGKSACTLAYHLMAGEETESGVAILNQIPDQYFRDDQPRQIVEDAEYAGVCVKMARMLVLGGFLGSPVPNSGAANA